MSAESMHMTPSRGDIFKISQHEIDEPKMELDIKDQCDMNSVSVNDILSISYDSPINVRKRRLYELSGLEAMSPVSEIAMNLSDTSLKTPCRKKTKSDSYNTQKMRGGAAEGPEEILQSSTEGQVDMDASLAAKDFFTGPVEESASSKHAEERPASSTVSSNFDLSTLNRNTIGPHDMESNIDIFHRPFRGYEELSFYGDDNHGHETVPNVDIVGSLIMSDDHLLSPEGSPKRFEIISKSQRPTAYHKSAEPSQMNRSRNQIQNATTPAKSFRIFHSLSSCSSVDSGADEDYMDLFEMEGLGDEDMNGRAPSNLNSLISGHIKSTKFSPELMKRLPVRRCLSLTDPTNTSVNKTRTSLFEPKTPEFLKPVQDKNSILTENNRQTSSPYNDTSIYSSRTISERCFKRPEPPSITISPINTKRYKTETYSPSGKENIEQHQVLKTIPANQPSQRPILRKHLSMNDADIMNALSRSSVEPDLIGDFSKPFCLPLTDGRHQDLKSISSDTLAKLISGAFKDSVASFKIIDCRYPYEFEGGHIRGAKNLFTQEQIMEEFVNCKTEVATVDANAPKRHILVFHCEFSSERGPKLSRFLRNNDRARNTDSYPALHYPEIYLLHGGYKEFYEKHSALCDPVSYRPMLEPCYAEAYRHFRAKSRSWSSDSKGFGGTINRIKKSRSRLVL